MTEWILALISLSSDLFTLSHTDKEIKSHTHSPATIPDCLSDR